MQLSTVYLPRYEILSYNNIILTFNTLCIRKAENFQELPCFTPPPSASPLKGCPRSPNPIFYSCTNLYPWHFIFLLDLSIVLTADSSITTSTPATQDQHCYYTPIYFLACSSGLSSVPFTFQLKFSKQKHSSQLPLNTNIVSAKKQEPYTVT